jgi:IS5 family transposase
MAHSGHWFEAIAMDQLSFASLDFAGKKKRTKRDVFLAEIAAVVPWDSLAAVIEPHYPKVGPQGGRRPFPLAVMLRIYCLQQWYPLSDPGAEEALYDIQSMRAFCGLELGRDAIPDETTILNFRRLLERHDLTNAVFADVAEHLAAKGELLRGGTIVDATLIAASPSTKNKAGKRDPEMRSSKKGNQWYFGMKAHIGVDADSGLVHTAGVTTGSVHDAKVMDELIREDDRAVYGDKGYANDRKKALARAAGVLWAVKEKAKPGQPLTPDQRASNRTHGSIRAKVEHVFRVLKCHFSYRRVRYRGITKNGAQVFALLALANLYLARGKPRLA